MTQREALGACQERANSIQPLLRQLCHQFACFLQFLRAQCQSPTRHQDSWRLLLEQQRVCGHHLEANPRGDKAFGQAGDQQACCGVARACRNRLGEQQGTNVGQRRWLRADPVRGGQLRRRLGLAPHGQKRAGRRAWSVGGAGRCVKTEDGFCFIYLYFVYLFFIPGALM